MQVCTSLQTDNHVSTSPLGFFTSRMSFLLRNQQRQSTEGKKGQKIANRAIYIIVLYTSGCASCNGAGNKQSDSLSVR